MGKFIKILFNLFIISMVLISFNVGTVYAEDTEYSSGKSLLGKMQEDTKNFLEKGSSEIGKSIDPKKMASNFQGLGQILTMVGIGVLIAVTTFMGIKYLTAGPEAQAKLKIQLVGIVVSGVVIFGAYYIWKIVVNIASQLQGVG